MSCHYENPSSRHQNRLTGVVRAGPLVRVVRDPLSVVVGVFIVVVILLVIDLPSRMRQTRRRTYSVPTSGGVGDVSGLGCGPSVP